MSLLARSPARSVAVASKMLVAALIAGLLYWARVVLIPVALAILIAFMLYPLVRLLRRWRFPNAAAVVAVVATALSVVTGLAIVIGVQIAEFSAELPGYRENIAEKVVSIRSAVRGGTIERLQDTIDTVSEEVEKAEEAEKAEKEEAAGGGGGDASARRDERDPVPVYLSPPPRVVDTGLLGAAGPYLQPLASAGLVTLLAFLLLLRWGEMRGRVLGFLEDNLAGTTSALDDAGKRIRGYLGAQALYHAGFGIVVGVGLTLLGVSYAALWGLCAAVFRYVPYLGPSLAVALPLLVSLVTSDGWSQVLYAGAFLLVLELIGNNLVEPWLYGSRVGLSEVGVVVAIIVWTFLWGAAGLVLATPLTACLVVLGEHVPALGFISRLIGAKTAIAPHYHLFQRLLAGDDLEASELVAQATRSSSKIETVESLLLPTLSLARGEWMKGRIDWDRAAAIPSSLPAAVERAWGQVASGENSAPEGDGERSDGETGSPGVVFWSVCPMSDASLPWVELGIEGLNCTAERITSKILTGSAVREMVEHRPAVVCIVHVQRRDLPRVTGRLKRLRGNLEDVPVMVARLGGEGYDRDERAGLAEAGATTLVASTPSLRARMAPWLASAPPPRPG